MQSIFEHMPFDDDPLFEQIVLRMHSLGDDVPSTLQDHLAIRLEVNPDICPIQFLFDDQ